MPPRPRPHRLHLAVMLGLALLAGLCVALSTQLPQAQQCVPAASGGTAVVTSTAYAQEHGTVCPAYPGHQ